MTMSTETRAVQLGNYLIETRGTIRGCASHFGISKSTVHLDVSVRLKRQNKELYLKVKQLLSQNLSERHIRGGQSTKEKYLHLKKVK